jgi:hypothetical protein
MTVADHALMRELYLERSRQRQAEHLALLAVRTSREALCLSPAEALDMELRLRQEATR